MPQWYLEGKASVIALGKVHEPVALGGEQVLKLELTEILKGQSVAKTLFPEDAQPFLGCIRPARIPKPSERFLPGSDVLIYLTRPKGENRLNILRISSRPNADWLKAIRGFLARLSAFGQKDAKWSTLLPPETRFSDGITYHVLTWAEPSGHEKAIVAILDHTLAELAAGEPGDPRHLHHLYLLVGRLPRALAHPQFKRFRAALVGDAHKGLQEGLDMWIKLTK